MSLSNSSRPTTWQLIAAFAAVYLIWGSTYLAIRFAIDTLPPFLMASTRFLLAGVILYAWTARQGAPSPSRSQWVSTAIIGGLLLMCGNGFVTWAEQRVPSGIAALLVAVVPLWMVLLDWLRPGGERPGAPVFVGLLVGLAGIALLVSPTDGTTEAIDPVGAVALIVATLCWSIGSLYSRTANLPSSPLRTTSMEMLMGGLLLLLLGTVMGEWNILDLSGVSLQSFLSVVYLTVFGSIIAFSAYVWLLRVTTAARASTYAYVNPVVAVFLGWALAGEALDGRTIIAAAVIVGAVVIITTYKGSKRAVTEEVDEAAVQIAPEKA